MFDDNDLELRPEHIRERLNLYDGTIPSSEDNDANENNAKEDDTDDINLEFMSTNEEPIPPAEAGQVRIVRKLTNDQFRGRLVEHFDILYKKNQIKWPRRHGVRPPTMPTCDNQRQNQL